MADLEPLLQECVLDELERLCADPTLVPAPLPEDGSLYPFLCRHGGSTHVVLLKVDHDRRRNVLNTLGVKLLSSPPV